MSRTPTSAFATDRTEVDVLVGCVRTGLGLEHAGALEVRLRAGVDWARLVQIALAHGVSPLLAHGLGQLPAGVLPSDFGDALRFHFDDNARRTEDLIRALGEILDGLVSGGVEAIPFKGPVLGALAYGNASLRRAGDLDLLVRPEQLDATCRFLVDAGFRDATEIEIGRPVSPAEDAAYRRFQCEYAFVRARDSLVVEPHWALARTTLAVDLDYPGLWARARRAPLWGREVPSLAAEDLLLVVCIHAAKHLWCRLQWICDIAALLGQQGGLDPDAFLTRARAQGVERIALVGLGLAREVLGAPLSVSLEYRLGADSEARALVGEVGGKLFTGGSHGSSDDRLSRLRLRMRERWRDRARYVLRTTTTPSLHHLHLVPQPHRLYPLLVPVELAHDYVVLPIRRGGRALAQAGRALWHAWRPRRRVRRVLVVDWVPHHQEGAGAPRMNALLHLLAGAGYRVTLYPAHRCTETDEQLYVDLPRVLEVVRGDAGLDGAEAFLVRRAREFDAIIIGRPLAMARIAPILDRRPELRAHARLVYDAEAIFAVREILQRRLLGEALDEVTATRMVAEEIGLARHADAVLTVSRQEQRRFEDHGFRRVHVLPHAVRLAATPRGFAERQGLLFVGRLAEDGWPNTDALVWFLDHVWPRVRERLAGASEPVTLVVAGKAGALPIATRQDPDVRHLGAVPDLTPLYAAARVFVAPTRFAAGVPLKVLEAAARGVPVVATQLLAEQLGWQPGQDLLVSEVSDDSAFADNVVTAYTRPDLWARLRTSAMARVKEYAPERALAVLESAFATTRLQP